MLRKIKEWWNPSLKCKRLGHEEGVVSLRIWRRSFEYREVAAEYMAEFERCPRCGKLGKILSEKKVDWFSGLEMSREDWRTMDRLGYLIRP